MRDAELEALLDTMGVTGLLEALARVARDKAEHVQTNWQDRSLAKRWNTLANQFDNMASSCDDPYRLR